MEALPALSRLLFSCASVKSSPPVFLEGEANRARLGEPSLGAASLGGGRMGVGRIVVVLAPKEERFGWEYAPDEGPVERFAPI